MLHAALESPEGLAHAKAVKQGGHKRAQFHAPLLCLCFCIYLTLGLLYLALGSLAPGALASGHSGDSLARSHVSLSAGPLAGAGRGAGAFDAARLGAAHLAEDALRLTGDV